MMSKRANVVQAEDKSYKIGMKMSDECIMLYACR